MVANQSAAKPLWAPDATADSTMTVPAELLLRRERSFRYERGGRVYATDGRVGVLQQVVVDEEAGEVLALVVEVEASGRRVLLSPELVDKTGGSAVFLTVPRAQIAERAAHAPDYDKRRFAKVDIKKLLGNASRVRQRNRRRVVAQAGRDFVETPIVSLFVGVDGAEPATPNGRG